MSYNNSRSNIKNFLLLFCLSILFSSCIVLKVSDTTPARAANRIKSTQKSKEYDANKPVNEDRIELNTNKHKIVVYIHQEFETYELKNPEISEGTIKGDLVTAEDNHLSTNGLKGFKKQGYLYDHYGEYHYYLNVEYDIAKNLNQTVTINLKDFENVKLVTKKATLINKPGLETGLAVAGVLIIVGTITALIIGFGNLIS